MTIILTGFWLAASVITRQADPRPIPVGEVRVIAVTVKKYEYNPSEIQVKRGDRIQLQLRALDRTHGFQIKRYPEGAPESGPLGLRFDSPQNKWRFEKGKEVLVEFIAESPDTYPFKCSVFCGFGHRRVKGRLIVEE